MVSSQFIASCALCILAAGIRAASDPEADAVSANAGRDMSFVMVYRKDCDHSLHMAVSDDSYNWRRPDGTWVLMWDRYTMKPHNFGFNETKDFREWRALGFFDRGEMKRTGFSEQKHGAVAQAPAEIVHALEEHFSK